MEERLKLRGGAVEKQVGRHRNQYGGANKVGRGNGHLGNSEKRCHILHGRPFGRESVGNTKPGDGWKFKGYGPKQLNGRDNQTRFAVAMDMDVDDVPAFVRTPLGGMM